MYKCWCHSYVYFAVRSLQQSSRVKCKTTTIGRCQRWVRRYCSRFSVYYYLPSFHSPYCRRQHGGKLRGKHQRGLINAEYSAYDYCISLVHLWSANRSLDRPKCLPKGNAPDCPFWKFRRNPFWRHHKDSSSEQCAKYICVNSVGSSGSSNFSFNTVCHIQSVFSYHTQVYTMHTSQDAPQVNGSTGYGKNVVKGLQKEEKLESSSVQKLSKGQEHVLKTFRLLIADLCQQFNGGHPGGAIGMAAIGVALWKYVMRYAPHTPTYFNRDRFVLSNGKP
jgi:hypothetical protein